MLGLMIKDLKLLKMQKNFMFLMVAMAVMFVATGLDLTFMISYLTFISSFFIISTVSYDEYNKSNSFLFTLPISRKDYVLEKYTLGLVICLSVWLITTIVCTVYKVSTGVQLDMIEWLESCFIILCLPLFSLTFMMPVQLKYGGEKGRIAFMIVTAVCFAIGFLVIKLLEVINVSIGAIIYNLPDIVFVIGLPAIVIVGMMISYFISVKIITNKEF